MQDSRPKAKARSLIVSLQLSEHLIWTLHWARVGGALYQEAKSEAKQGFISPETCSVPSPGPIMA